MADVPRGPEGGRLGDHDAGDRLWWSLRRHLFPDRGRRRGLRLCDCRHDVGPPRDRLARILGRVGHLDVSHDANFHNRRRRRCILVAAHHQRGRRRCDRLYISRLTLQPWMVLLIINVFLLIVGCFIDTASSILVLSPLLLPIAQSIGVDPIHFGIIVVTNLSIGTFTPPFGINIFVAQSIFDVPLRSIYAGLAPFIGVAIVGLMILTYVPELSLWLVRFLG